MCGRCARSGVVSQRVPDTARGGAYEIYEPIRFDDSDRWQVTPASSSTALDLAYRHPSEIWIACPSFSAGAALFGVRLPPCTRSFSSFSNAPTWLQAEVVFVRWRASAAARSLLRRLVSCPLFSDPSPCTSVISLGIPWAGDWTNTGIVSVTELPFDNCTVTVSVKVPGVVYVTCVVSEVEFTTVPFPRSNVTDVTSVGSATVMLTLTGTPASVVVPIRGTAVRPGVMANPRGSAPCPSGIGAPM